MKGGNIMEIWDAYNENGELAGCDLIRGEEIPNGLYHLVSEVLVRHIDGTFLLVQRDLSKENFPGAYEAGAGGSALKGENSYTAALRELKEETGITADKLTPIYKTKSHNTLYYGYICITDCDKNSVILQEGETTSYIWLDKNEFLNFVDSEKYVVVHKNRLKNYLDMLRNESNCIVREITNSDFDGLMSLYMQLHDNPFPKKTPKLLSLWQNILNDKNHHIIVISENGKIVSSCVCVVIPNLTHNQQPYAFVENVITDVNYRKRGFATKCLNYAKEIAELEGCYKLMLLTGSKKESTLKFYEQAGYNKNDKTAFIQWI